MMRWVGVVVLLVAGAGCGRRPLAPSPSLVPRPEIVRRLDGDPLTAVSGTARAHPGSADVVRAMLAMPVEGDETLPSWCAVLPAAAEHSSTAAFAPPDPRGALPGAYALNVDAGGIALRGFDREGLRNAAATAQQLLGAIRSGRTVPAMWIEDAPALRVRAALIDLARDHAYNAGSMRALVDFLASVKCNMLVLYLEGRFAIPELGIGLPGAMTAEDARELTVYGRERGVRIVPQVNLFGHMAQILRNQQDSLREAPGDSYQVCPLAEGARPFLEEIVAALAAAFDDPWLHVGCDEVVDWPGFATCDRCRAFVQARGRGALFAEHVSFLRDTAARHGKRIAIWGDGLLQLPDALRDVPRDVIVFDWHYDADQRVFPSLQRFAEHGFEVVAAPLAGTVRDFYRDANVANLDAFLAAAADAQVLGGCACVWELTDLRVWPQHLYAIARAAEVMWTGGVPSDRFDERFEETMLGIAAGGGLARLCARLPAPDLPVPSTELLAAPGRAPLRKLAAMPEYAETVRAAGEGAMQLERAAGTLEEAIAAGGRRDRLEPVLLAVRQHRAAMLRMAAAAAEGSEAEALWTAYAAEVAAVAPLRQRVFAAHGQVRAE